LPNGNGKNGPIDIVEKAITGLEPHCNKKPFKMKKPYYAIPLRWNRKQNTSPFWGRKEHFHLF
jgi:hypothetical protein